MTDQLFLSIWLDRHAQANRLRYFQKVLSLFPFSQREQPQSTVSIQAINLTEPPLLEKAINGPVDLSEIEPVFSEYRGDDIAYEFESWWDLWHFDGDWKLKPTRVSLSCFGRQFDNGTDHQTAEQEDLRIDFGVDSTFLPTPDIPGSGRLIESNIKSLLRLVHDVESALPTRKRLLATESGENFAERLQQTLTASGGVQ
ncbi:MAG: hypothetical protein ACJ746_15075 [Bryobacteraceae bacterium]